jgi:hypothetical protein
MRTGFPLKSLRLIFPPFKLLREKAGAVFPFGNFWIPKELQEGFSGGEREAALPAWEEGIRMIAVPIPIKNKKAIFLFILDSG